MYKNKKNSKKGCEKMYLTSKKEKLKHYAGKELNSFIQFDGWYFEDKQGDSNFKPDSDGDCLSGRETFELMNGADVRILIPENTPRDIAIRLIGKIARWIETSGLLHESRGKQEVRKKFFRTLVDKGLTVEDMEILTGKNWKIKDGIFVEVEDFVEEDNVHNDDIPF